MDLIKLASALIPDTDLLPLDKYEEMYPPRDLPKGAQVTRLAPSPTGFIHLGNLYSALADERIAHTTGGIFYLRIEDTDEKRRVEGAVESVIRSLKYFNVNFDEGAEIDSPLNKYGPYYQRRRASIYRAFAKDLIARGLAYPCFCSRKDLRMLASAPHLGDAGIVYPGTCRNLTPAEVAERTQKGLPASWRFRGQGRVFAFDDLVMGPQRQSIEESGGDFNMKRADGIFSYQLAVSVDDGLMGITQVIRGRDILPSTVRQLAILDALGMPAPEYGHIPLLLDTDGERLAKRQASLSLEALRTRNVSPWRVTGLLARAAGLIDRKEAVHPGDLVQNFSPDRLTRTDYTLTQADMLWLEGKNNGTEDTGTEDNRRLS